MVRAVRNLKRKQVVGVKCQCSDGVGESLLVFVAEFIELCQHLKRINVGWDIDPSHFVQAMLIPDDEIWKAHMVAKGKLLSLVENATGTRMDLNRLTIGFARRAAAYKRADLIFSDLERLVQIAGDKVQFVFAGKAHPKDGEGKQVIKNVFAAKIP